MRQMFLIIVSCLLPGYACANGPINETAGKAQQAAAHHLDMKSISALLDKARAQLGVMPDCRAKPNNVFCEVETVSSSPSAFNWPEDDAERILIVDVDHAPFQTLGRYQNRVVAYIEADVFGVYHDVVVTTSMTRGAQIILRDILGSDPTYIPAGAFDDDFLAAAHKTGIWSGDNAPDPSHASLIFTFLAEHNPRASFVSATYPKPPTDIYCGLNFPAMRAFYEHAAASISRLAHQHSISFINLSMGPTRDTEHAIWKDRCGNFRLGEDDVGALLAAQAIFYRAVASIEGAVLVQAGLGVSQESDANIENAPIDCTTSGYPNRLRVASAAYPSAGIPAEGGRFDEYRPYIRDMSAAAHACNDVFVNFGYDQRGSPGVYPFRVTLGMGWSLFPWMYPSFAAPIALSELIWLSKDVGPVRSRDRPENILNNILGNGRSVRDPIAHRCFQDHRLGMEWDAKDLCHENE